MLWSGSIENKAFIIIIPRLQVSEANLFERISFSSHKTNQGIAQVCDLKTYELKIDFPSTMPRLLSSVWWTFFWLNDWND